MVTHHRLEAGPEGGLVPREQLSRWWCGRRRKPSSARCTPGKVQSYRDLPILINA